MFQVGGLRSLWSSKYGFFIVEGGWSSDRYEGGLNLFYAPETDFGPRWTQTPEKDLFRHILTCFHHFWALFCLKPTRNALFTPFLVQNGQVAVTKQVQIGFSRPGPFWAPEWPQTPKMGFLDIKYTYFLHFWALFYPNPTRNALFKPFSINF